MSLSSELISQFAKITNDEKPKKSEEATLYGEVVELEEMICVRFDGAEELTPVTTIVEKDDTGEIVNYKYGAASVKSGDRVSVSLKNHSATITGNLSDPPAGRAEFKVNKDSILARVGATEMWIKEEGVTFKGLSEGTTVINGGCIKTGIIEAQHLNLTGAIKFIDLSQEVQNEFAGIEETVNGAVEDVNTAIRIANGAVEDANTAIRIAQSITIPNYIKSTYIDATTIQSPSIEGNDIRVYGTFQTMGYNGASSIAMGYMGAAKGLDAQGNDTYGVALSYAWNSSTLEVSDKYLIVTNGGVRMQAGNHSMTVTSNGCYVDGKLIGTAGSTAVFG